MSYSRNHLGQNARVWSDLSKIFAAALPALEAQSFPADETPTTNTGTSVSSSTFMAMNHGTLLKDLERVDDLLLIGRNLLASTQEAQNIAAENRIDQVVLGLISLCIRVSARGYDGDAGGRYEAQWVKIVQCCQ